MLIKISKRIRSHFNVFFNGLNTFNKIMFVFFILYAFMFLICIIYMEFELHSLNSKIDILESRVAEFYYIFRLREAKMVRIKYVIQEVVRRRLMFARYLREAFHPFDDETHSKLQKEFLPYPWAKYGTKR